MRCLLSDIRCGRRKLLTISDRRMPTDGFDTVRFLLSNYSEQANKELHAIKDEKELTAKKKDILDYFTKVVNQEQDFSGLLSSYFERRGFEKNFNYKIVINNLEMIGNDTIIVYRSEGFSNRRPSDRGRRPISFRNVQDQDPG